jgi:hypothetical protein
MDIFDLRNSLERATPRRRLRSSCAAPRRRFGRRRQSSAFTPGELRSRAESMCNDYANHEPYDEYRRAFSETKILVRFPHAAPNLEPRDDIWPTDTAPVIRATEDGPEFVQLPWGFPPGRPKGPPVINMRRGPRRRGSGWSIVLARIHRGPASGAIARGELRPEKGGRRIFVTRRMLREWREACRVQPLVSASITARQPTPPTARSSAEAASNFSTRAAGDSLASLKVMAAGPTKRSPRR